MNATNACPFPARWTPGQIAEAVPPRLPGTGMPDLSLLELDLSVGPVDASHAAANRAAPRTWHRGYLIQAALPARFHVHG